MVHHSCSTTPKNVTWCIWAVAKACRVCPRFGTGNRLELLKYLFAELSVACPAQETAINIGFACSLLRTEMVQYIVTASTKEVCRFLSTTINPGNARHS